MVDFNIHTTRLKQVLDEKRTDNRVIIQKLVESELYLSFRDSFGGLTGLPIALRPKEYWQPPLHGEKRENAICSAIARNPEACSCCLEAQSKLMESAQDQGQVVVCPLGMVDIAVPVILRGRCVAFLHTGQLLPSAPSEREYKKAEMQLKNWDLDVPVSLIKNSYMNAEVYSSQRQEAIVQLLTQFADRLAEQANLILIKTRSQEPPLISRAKKYIDSNITEVIRLEDISKYLNISPFYFCRQFKKYTKLRFADYLTRTRIERAKALLRNPNRRVSEVAFDSGFQSIPHFNRSFKRITGVSPTIWRQN